MVILQLNDMNIIEALKIKDNPQFQNTLTEICRNKKMTIEKKKILKNIRNKKV